MPPDLPPVILNEFGFGLDEKVEVLDGCDGRRRLSDECVDRWMDEKGEKHLVERWEWKSSYKDECGLTFLPQNAPKDQPATAPAQEL